MALEAGDLEGFDGISTQDINTINQALEQSVGVDLNSGLEIIGYVGFGINILYVLVYIFTAIGLYKLSKKLGDKYSWLAFVPVVQLYTLIKTSGYGFLKGILLLVVHIIIAMIISTIVIMGLTPFLSGIYTGGNLTSIFIASIIVGLVSGLIIVFIATFFLYSGIAKRTDQSQGTAILMTLFPWCMLWIVANRIDDNSISTGNNESQKPLLEVEEI
ncbi:hypothetical protein N9J72_00010 [Candidatus Gracilibacteria bacterium]|nr:hypothetical protein [Candidatus Gracilibacteria bacterium]